MVQKNGTVGQNGQAGVAVNGKRVKDFSRSSLPFDAGVRHLVSWLDGNGNGVPGESNREELRVVPAGEKGWGEKFKQRREAKGLSKELVAALAGISLRSVDRYETGVTEPVVSDADRLYYALENPVGALIQLLGEWAAEAAGRPGAFVDLRSEQEDALELRRIAEQQMELADRILNGISGVVPQQPAVARRQGH